MTEPRKGDGARRTLVASWLGRRQKALVGAGELSGQCKKEQDSAGKGRQRYCPPFSPGYGKLQCLEGVQ